MIKCHWVLVCFLVYDNYIFLLIDKIFRVFLYREMVNNIRTIQYGRQQWNNEGAILMRVLAPDLPIGIDKQSIWMESRHNLIQLLNEHATESHNRSTTSSLVINRAETRLTSPRKLIPTCKSKNISKNKQPTLDTTIMGSNTIHGPKAQIRWRSTRTNSVRQIVRLIPVDSERIWTWDQNHWKGYLLRFLSV